MFRFPLIPNFIISIKLVSVNVDVSKITTKQFDDYLIIPFSKDWLSLNNNKQIEFSVEVKESKLVLSGNLVSLDRTKDVDINGK